MKHAGKASDAALRLIGLSFILCLGILLVGALARYLGSLIGMLGGGLLFLWVLFTGFTFYFFRDPDPNTPADPKAIVSPAHGKVDLIDETEELEFMGGRCRRISIFLSVVDVHVQQAPIAGKVGLARHKSGQFLNALKAESATFNENYLIGFDSLEKPGEKVAIKLLAGLIARRIVPWIAMGEDVKRGERVSLIQFGSRVDLYLPLSTKVVVPLGARVVGGETIVATRE